MRLRIIVDRDLCEANGICVGEAPEVFGLDEDNQMGVLDERPGPERAASVRRALDRCPRGALSVVEEPSARGFGGRAPIEEPSGGEG